MLPDVAAELVLSGRPITFGTVCSGSDLCAVVWDKLSTALGKLIDLPAGALARHVFSCESCEWKRQFILDSYPVPHVYVDVGHLCAPTAFDARCGRDTQIPCVDVLIGGFSCKTVSRLNSKPEEAKACVARQAGTTGVTFAGILGYAASKRPKLWILENVVGLLHKQDDTSDGVPVTRNMDVVASTLSDLGYTVTHRVLDAQDFGAPQRRQRVWITAVLLPRMPAFLSLAGHTHASAIAQLLNLMSAGVESYPVGLFLSPSAESGGAHEPMRAQQAGTPKWMALHHSMFLQHGLCWPPTSEEVRAVCGTYTDVLTRRESEVILFMSMTASADPHSEVEVVIDVSQNINRCPIAVGSTPCLTPCGCPWLLQQKRPLTGVESLRIQGLTVQSAPLIATLSNRQCQDLAGNAFSGMVAAAMCLTTVLTARLTNG